MLRVKKRHCYGKQNLGLLNVLNQLPDLPAHFHLVQYFINGCLLEVLGQRRQAVIF